MTFLSIVSMTFFILSIIGFTKPSMLNRIFKQKSKLKAGGFLLLGIIFSGIATNKTPKMERIQTNNTVSTDYSAYGKYKSDVSFYNANKDIKLKKLNDDYPRRDAKKIVTGFAAMNHIQPELHDSFYYCLGDYTRTKDQELSADKALQLCFKKYQLDAKWFVSEQSIYSYFDLKDQFNAWDGSHKKSIEEIKQNMKDKNSFKHLETTYQYIGEGKNLKLRIVTIFTGKNSFNATVTSRATTIVSPKTGIVFNINIE